jgi:hypothetical protein
MSDSRASEGATVRVTARHVYGVAAPSGAASRPRPDVQYHPGEPAPPGPDLVNYEIRDKEKRLGLRDGQGMISITVQAGSGSIGELFVNIQFEGPSGKPDLCMAGQNELLEQASGWLHEILEKLSPEGGGWQLRVDAQPCPQATVELALDRAVSLLQGEDRVQIGGGVRVSHDRTLTYQQRTGHQRKS